MSAFAPSAERLRRPIRMLTPPKWAALAILNLMSVGGIAFVLHGAGLQHLAPELRTMRWGWVAGAAVCDVLAYSLHAWRWKLLLTPIRRVSIFDTGRSIYVSLLVNELLPFRPGEAVRCLLLSRSARMPLPAVFASALVERIFDGVWAVVGLGLCACMVKLPLVFRGVGLLVSFLTVACTALLLIAFYGRSKHLPRFVAQRGSRVLEHLNELRKLGRSGYLCWSFLASGLYMAAQFLPLYMLVRASRLPVAWTASVALVVFIRFGSIAPQALGNFGAFQAISAQTLTIFGVLPDLAKRFSLFLWAAVNIPLMLIGGLALAWESESLAELCRAAAGASRARSAAPSEVLV